MSLDLLVPGLLPPAADIRLPHLERWLARGRVERDDARSAEAWLARRFGMAEAAVAPVSLAVDEAPQPGQWLRADPVYARVERDTLVLHHSAMLAITPDEARALVGSLRELFAADFLEIRVPRPDRWYVRVPAGELPATTPLSEALGCDVFGRLPRGTGRINWPSAITEVQMLFATHPVNLAREAERRPPINAVWFWGGGALPEGLASPYRRVFARDPFAGGLAHLSGAALAEPPGGLRDLAAGESTLVVLDPVGMALDAGDLDAWAAAARRLDDDWFATLGSAIAGFDEIRIILPSARNTRVATLTPSARWRIFRGRKPLAAHA